MHYTNAQVSFYLDFVDGVLNKDNLALLLKDYPNSYSEATAHINSAKIQQDILAIPYAGREIGNFSLEGKNGLEISAKFIELERIIKQNKGKTAIYSSYFNNGILLLADYLQKRSYSFEILRPDKSVEEISRVLDNFNYGNNKILLIHPEITEGISLQGVEQLHILEPVRNIALEKQIIGRSVRYQSHAHLPKDRQHVDIYLWQSEVIYSKLAWPTEAGLVRREHWRKRYREVNPNLWTNGIAQLDMQYFKKDETPDHRVSYAKDQLAGDMQSFRLVSSKHSLENELNANNSITLSSDLSSKFAVPLIYFNFTKSDPFYLRAFKSADKVIEVIDSKGIDFDIEIPHNDNLNVGFGLRFSEGKVKALSKAEDIAIKSLDTDLGFLSRLHYEFEKLPNFSFYWKNELDANIFFYVPAVGIGIGLRESIGVQTYLNEHLGINLEIGYEGRILKDTILSEIEFDDKEKEEIENIFKKTSLMSMSRPYVTIGLFSSYF